MYQPDILIHIDEELNDHQIHDLEKQLSMKDGVLSACVHTDRRHLMVVDYDPANVRGSEILSHVRATGVHAEMIGL
jgi:hypothetical protein